MTKPIPSSSRFERRSLAEVWRGLARRGGRLLGTAADPSSKPVILMYHRVAHVDHDPWSLAVAPERFERQMAYVNRHRRPMPMNAFVRRLFAGKLPADAIAVTFDDGYLDNLLFALPILERHRVPATLFLTTGPIESPGLFWWDELTDLILAQPRPMDAEIVIAGVRHPLCWGEPSRLPPPWRAWDEPRDERERAYVQIWRQLRDLGEAERQDAMARLRTMLGPVDQQRDRSMNAGEFARFAASRTIDIGAHSITHPALTTLEPDERRRQIRESRDVCRVLTGGAVSGFAYPYGDMDAAARDDVIASGFEWACSTRKGVVAPSSDRFALPRLPVADWEAEDFATVLALG